MNIQDYISSGILESYAMGVCTEQERAEVERLVQQFPELRLELSSIEQGLEQMAFSQAIEPPSDLKAKVLADIKNIEKKTASSLPPTTEIKETPVLRPVFNYKWLSAASIALLVGSIISNVVLYRKYNSASNQIAQLQSQNSVLASDMEVSKAQYRETSDMLASISDPSVQVIQLNGVTSFPEAKVTLYWNKSSEDVYIAVNSLPVPPQEKQYQLWAIVDGQPVDAGVFEMAENMPPVQKMHSFKNAQAFAVTMEKKGGNPTPTMEAMYVIANV